MSAEKALLYIGILLEILNGSNSQTDVEGISRMERKSPNHLMKIVLIK